MNDLLLRSFSAVLFRLTRFGIVGGFATFIYLVTSFALEYWTTLTSAANNAIALMVSLVVSYFGHKLFTYRIEGNHKRRASLFLLSTVIIIAGAGVLQWFVGRLSGSAYASYLCVTLYYPVASFILHNALTFSVRMRQ